MDYASGWQTAALLFAALTATVLAEESALYWIQENEKQSCIFSLVGDPTDWVPTVKSDPNYEIVAQPYCFDANVARFSALATNPSIPDLVITSDTISGGLMSAEMKEDGMMEGFFGAAQNITGIAIDYKAQNIYLTDSLLGLVLVQYGRLRLYYKVLTEDPNDAKDLAVDPDAGVLFWIESDKIKKLELSGGDPEVIASDLTAGSLVTIDREHKNVIYLDGETIYSRGYDESSGHELVKGLTGQDKALAGIVYDQGYIFGTVKSSGNLMIWKADSGELMANLQFSDTKASAGRIAVRKTQPVAPKGKCAENNGDCSQICTYDSSGDTHCQCGLGFLLKNDDQSCYSDYAADNFVLVTDVDINAVYQIDTKSGQIHAVPVQRTPNQNIVTAVYDPEGKRVIWLDSGNNTLRSLALTGDSTEKIIHTFDKDALISSIALDKDSQVVYYIDSNQTLIGRVRLGGGQETVITLSETESPFEIQIDVHGEYLYWTNTGSPATIYRASMSDGSDKKAIVNSGITDLSGLALNIQESELFWVDNSNGKVEKATMDGEEREMMLTDPEVYSLAVDSDYLYLLRSHDVRQYSLTDKLQSTLGLRFFSYLNGISVYPPPPPPPEPTTEMAKATTTEAAAATTAATTTTTTTTQAPAAITDELTGVPMVTIETSETPAITDELTGVPMVTIETSETPDTRGGSSTVIGMAWPNLVLWTIIWIYQGFE